MWPQKMSSRTPVSDSKHNPDLLAEWSQCAVGLRAQVLYDGYKHKYMVVGAVPGTSVSELTCRIVGDVIVNVSVLSRVWKMLVQPSVCNPILADLCMAELLAPPVAAWHQ